MDRWPHVQMIVHVRQNYFLSRLPKEIRESAMANGTSRFIERLRVNEIVAVRKNHELSPLMICVCVSEFACPRHGPHFGSQAQLSVSCCRNTSSGCFPCFFA